jgi:type VI secretion system lysozyme-like protein
MSSFYRVLLHQSHDIQDKTLVEDLAFHLTGLLNARQSMIPTQAAYGLPDICIESSPAYVARMVEATRALIHRFEPRLKIQQIHCDEKARVNHQLCLRISALAENATPLQFQAFLGSQGCARVVMAWA